jgi:hypothetical protein
VVGRATSSLERTLTKLQNELAELAQDTNIQMETIQRDMKAQVPPPSQRGATAFVHITDVGIPIYVIDRHLTWPFPASLWLTCARVCICVQVDRSTSEYEAKRAELLNRINTLIPEMAKAAEEHKQVRHPCVHNVKPHTHTPLPTIKLLYLLPPQ